jgi:replicative DNA helicase
MQNPNDIIGYSLGDGFQKVTRALLGIQTKTLTVVAANQSVGKTQICQNFAMYQTIELNHPILWFSLEMDKNRMTFRNLAILSGIESQLIMTGNITSEQKSVIDMCAIRLRQAPFYLSERGHDLSEAIAIARRYVQTKHVKTIYVDYAQLQYVTDRRTETRSRELGVISKTWKEFSQEMNVSVVLISQLGRQALQAETAEAEHGFGSYEIAQDADNYITLKDNSAEEIEQGGIEHGNKTLNISKNRMGEKSVLIDIYADGPTYRMREC